MFTGGAAKGRLWPQIVADVLGVPVRVPVVKESTALGAAIYAGVGAGLYRRPRGGRRSGSSGSSGRSSPTPAHAAAYDDHYARWREPSIPRILDLSEARPPAPDVVAGRRRRRHDPIPTSPG